MAKLRGMCEADATLLLPTLEALSMLCLNDDLQVTVSSAWLIFGHYT